MASAAMATLQAGAPCTLCRPPAPPPPAQTYSSHVSLSGPPLVAAIAVPVLATVLLLSVGAVAMFLAARRRSHRGIMGKVSAPPPGPDTTLLMTGAHLH
jgi:hypothetical protein